MLPPLKLLNQKPVVIDRRMIELTGGSSQYFTIPEFTMESGDIVTFIYQAPSSTLLSTDYLLGGDVAGAARALLTMTGTGDFSESGFDNTMLLDGNSVATNSAYPTDGKLHTIELTSSSTNIIGTIGARYNGVSTFNGIISDFKITRGVDMKRFYKLNETIATTTITDYGSDRSNGTAVNLTSSDAILYNRTIDGWLDPSLNLLEEAF